MEGYTALECRFLVRAHGTLPSVETVDFSNCPQRIFDRIMEFRAKRIGPAFKQFQEEQRIANTQPTLEDNLAAAKLF